jgi:hypothetical protein
VYAWIWQKLPGAWPFKVLASVVSATALVALLFIVVFPAVEPNLPFNNVTIDETTTTPPAPAPTGSPSKPASPGTAASSPTVIQEGGAPTVGDLIGGQGGSSEGPVGPVTITPAPLPS